MEEDPQLHHAIHLNALRKTCEAVGGAAKLLKKYKALVNAPPSQQPAHATSPAVVGSAGVANSSPPALNPSNTKKTSPSKTPVAKSSNVKAKSSSSDPAAAMLAGDFAEFDSISNMREVTADEADAAAQFGKHNTKASKFRA